MQSFDIYFSGQLLPDTSPDEARIRIGRLFRLEGAALERLFSGKAVRIKKGVDVDTAGRYREAFRGAGALIDVVPEGSPPPPPRPGRPGAGTEGAAPPARPVDERTHSAGERLELLPPKTGSLEDCAPEIRPAPIGDIDWMSLDAPGVIIDETPPPPPAEIDTGGISMSEANAFTLEDCRDTRPARPLPDISHLTLSDDEK